MLSRPTIQKWVQSWFLAENLCQTTADTGSAGTRPSGLAWRLLSITFHNKTLAQVSLALMILGTQTVTFLNTYSHDSVRYQTAICHSFSYFHTHFSWSWHTSAIITSYCTQCTKRVWLSCGVVINISWWGQVSWVGTHAHTRTHKSGGVLQSRYYNIVICSTRTVEVQSLVISFSFSTGLVPRPHFLIYTLWR